MKSYCIYCGENVDWEPDGMAEAHRKMMEHDRKCPKNPMVQELAAMRSLLSQERERLERAQAHLDDFKRLFNSLVPTSSKLKNPDGFSLPESLSAFDMVAAGELDALKAEKARLASLLHEYDEVVDELSNHWATHQNEYDRFDLVQQKITRLRAAMEAKP